MTRISSISDETTGINNEPAYIKIGEYQLQNLQDNRVHFLFLDLSDANSPECPKSQLLKGSKRIDSGEVVNFVLNNTEANKTTPIVIVCEDGQKSKSAALKIAENSFINIFVVDGGTNGFS